MTTATATNLTAIETAIDDEFFEGPDTLYSAYDARGVMVYGLRSAVVAAVPEGRKIYEWYADDDVDCLYAPAVFDYDTPGRMFLRYADCLLWTADAYEFGND